MNLFTNGCSFTWGAEIYENELNFYPEKLGYHPSRELIEYREEKVWAGQLHKKLNTTKMYNLSIGSGSNQRIVRTTLDFFINRIDNKLPIDDFVAVIQWTEPSRYEIYDDELKDYLSITNNGIYPPTDKSRSKVLLTKFYEHEKNFFNDYCVQLVNLSSFFKLHNIKYLFCTMNSYNTPSGYYYYNINWLEHSPNASYINNLDESLTYSKGHPNLEGHKHIAERIYNRLKELYNI